jgi:hypothetical protein
MVCIDNSEWTRSGDYAPTRFQAQADAVNLLAGAKTQANPEATVGVLTMSGKTPRILVTPTPDLGKVLNCMTDIPIEGEINVSASVQIAQLALKHRQNKNQRQRIVIFTASPLKEDKVRGRDRPAAGAPASRASRLARRARAPGPFPPTLSRQAAAMAGAPFPWRPPTPCAALPPRLPAGRAVEDRQEAQEEQRRGRHRQLRRAGGERGEGARRARRAELAAAAVPALVDGRGVCAHARWPACAGAPRWLARAAAPRQRLAASTAEPLPARRASPPSPHALPCPAPRRRSPRSTRRSTATATATWSPSRLAPCCPTCSSARPSSR